MLFTKTLRNTVDLRSWVLLLWLEVGLTLFILSLCSVEVGLMLPRRSAICWALSVWSWESSVSREADEGSTHSVTVLTTVPSNEDIYNKQTNMGNINTAIFFKSILCMVKINSMVLRYYNGNGDIAIWENCSKAKTTNNHCFLNVTYCWGSPWSWGGGTDTFHA